MKITKLAVLAVLTGLAASAEAATPLDALRDSARGAAELPAVSAPAPSPAAGRYMPEQDYIQLSADSDTLVRVIEMLQQLEKDKPGSVPAEYLQGLQEISPKLETAVEDLIMCIPGEDGQEMSAILGRIGAMADGLLALAFSIKDNPEFGALGGWEVARIGEEMGITATMMGGSSPFFRPGPSLDGKASGQRGPGKKLADAIRKAQRDCVAPANPALYTSACIDTRVQQGINSVPGWAYLAYPPLQGEIQAYKRKLRACSAGVPAGFYGKPCVDGVADAVIAATGR